MADTMRDLRADLDAVLARVERLEALTGAGAPDEAEHDQEAEDRALLGRFANTHEDAVAQEAARARMAERGLQGPDYARPGPDEGDGPPADAE